MEAMISFQDAKIGEKTDKDSRIIYKYSSSTLLQDKLNIFQFYSAPG